MKKLLFGRGLKVGFMVVMGLLGMVQAGRAEMAKPFDESAYRDAVVAGKTVLLQFHADWCPTCKKQAVSLDQVLSEDLAKDVVAFQVNFDTAKSLKKELRVTSQSTVVVFMDGKEKARSTGATSVGALRDLLKKAL